MRRHRSRGRRICRQFASVCPRAAAIVRVVVIENLAKKKHGALRRVEPFQKNEKRDRQRVIRFGRRRNERLGQPLADVFLAPDAGRLQVIDAKARDDRDQERLRGSDVVVGRFQPSNERFLQEIFGVGDAADHPISDGKEKTAILIELVSR